MAATMNGTAAHAAPAAPSARLTRRLVRMAHALCLALAAPAHAGLMADATRVIVPLDAGEQSLQLANLNAYPVMVQAWVDDGALDTGPEDARAPMLVLPPVFRLEAGGQAGLRLLYTGAPLPTDRESMFWLNLYEMPPRPPPEATGVGNAVLTVAVRTQLKVFLRPPGLKVDPFDVIRHLAFTLHHDDGGTRIEISNDSPYHATLAALEVGRENRWQATPPPMVAPFGAASVALPSTPPGPGEVRVRFSLIDDAGNARTDERTVHGDGPAAASGPTGTQHEAPSRPAYPEAATGVPMTR